MRERCWRWGVLLASACQTGPATDGTPTPAVQAEPATTAQGTPPPKTPTSVRPPPATPSQPVPGASPGQPMGAPAVDFFSYEWAKRRADESESESAAAEALRQRAHALYKQKKDAEAVPLYEQALQLHPSGQLYYDYGNSLSNVNRLQDSVLAYGLAVRLEYAHPEVAIYNTACAQSRLGNATAAYGSLEDAVSKGYLAFAKMERDPDLEFLHKRPDWKERFQALSANPEVLVGKLNQFDDRINHNYTVCPNGTIEAQHYNGLDESCCKSRSIGQLSVKDGKFLVTWQKLCGRSGTGGRAGDGMTEVCQEYKGCTKEEVCKAASGKKAELLLTVAEARKFVGRPPVTDGEVQSWTLAPFDGAPPAVCQQEQ